MALIPYEPFRDFKRDLDKWFNEFPKALKDEFGGPRIDIYQTAGEVIASCEIPGIENKEDLYIDVDEKMLTISGRIHRMQELNDEQMHRRERLTGQFNRTLGLPAIVIPEQAKASYRNGILEVRMPKAKVEERKGLDIEWQ